MGTLDDIYHFAGQCCFVRGVFEQGVFGDIDFMIENIFAKEV